MEDVPNGDKVTTTETGSPEAGTRSDLRFGTIPGLMRDVAERDPSGEALVDLAGDAAVRLTFAEVRDRSESVARGLLAHGVSKGDRIAIWAPNIWEWVVAVVGLQSVGAVVVPLNTRYKGIEAADILRRSHAKALFTVDGFLGNDYFSMLSEATDAAMGPGAPETGLPELERVILLRSEPAGAGHSEPSDTAVLVDTLGDLVSAGEGVAQVELDQRIDSLESGDVADMLYTSGTTGAPKGVVQTHASTLRAAGDWADIVGLEARDRYLVINPFFHSFGYKAGIVAGLITGCTLVPIPTFDVQRAMEVIQAERISMIPGPPTIYHTLLNDPSFDPTQVDTLRLAVTGAAAVPVSLVEAMRDTLGFENVITAYGLTEATGFVTACRAGDADETISHTSGRAMPGVEVRVVDDDGNEMPAGEPGEVVVRGYNVMTEYFEDPEQTSEAIDADGWLHTGDIATMDANGYIDITDRKKDMFIVGGFNAYPAEIEALLGNHPEVSQAAVVGVPDERMGEVGHAYVVPVAGTTPDGARIRAWAKDNMANYKVPRTVEVVDSLPVNAAGKVLRFELRERAGDGGQ